MDSPHNPFATFFRRITTRAAADQMDCLINEVIETGGTYTSPDPANNTSSHLFEISLHGVCAYGCDDHDALRNWIRAARTTLDAALIPNPRNHAEEIHNARRFSAAEIYAAFGATK